MRKLQVGDLYFVIAGKFARHAFELECRAGRNILDRLGSFFVGQREKPISLHRRRVLDDERDIDNVVRLEGRQEIDAVVVRVRERRLVADG